MDDNEIPTMPVPVAIRVWKVALDLRALGFEVPDEVQFPLAVAETTLLDSGCIEPYICSHGHAKMRPTPLLFEALRA